MRCHENLPMDPALRAQVLGIIEVYETRRGRFATPEG